MAGLIVPGRWFSTAGSFLVVKKCRLEYSPSRRVCLRRRGAYAQTRFNTIYHIFADYKLSSISGACVLGQCENQRIAEKLRNERAQVADVSDIYIYIRARRTPHETLVNNHSGRVRVRKEKHAPRRTRVFRRV